MLSKSISFFSRSTISGKMGIRRAAMSSTKLDIFNPTPEHLELRKMVRAFVEKEVDPQAMEYNREEKFNIELFRKLGDLGLLGIVVDPQYGGAGMDATAAVIVTEELASADPGFTCSYATHSMLLINNILRNANEEQKMRFLPPACSGEKIGGICMSEPSVGTDVLGMRSMATPSADGSYFTLNGTKMWITNGTLDGKDTGDMFLLYAKTNPNAKYGGLTSFVVEKGMPGFYVGQKINDKCGMRSSPTAELVFENVKIPKENVIGEVGGAVFCMMRNLQIERLGIGAMCLGIARRSIEVMSKYSQERKAFGKPIADYGQIQKMMAESYAEYMAGRSYIYQVAYNLDLDAYGKGLDGDGVKLYMAGTAKRIADRAIQCLGGYGYVGDYQVERLWRDSKVTEIFGGTNEAHHKNMAKELAKLQGRIE